MQPLAFGDGLKKNERDRERAFQRLKLWKRKEARADHKGRFVTQQAQTRVGREQKCTKFRNRAAGALGAGIRVVRTNYWNLFFPTLLLNVLDKANVRI